MQRAATLLEPALRTATVDVVIPAYNEERALATTIPALRSYLADRFPFDWTITIVDNASTDGTLEVAARLAGEHDDVRVVHTATKGKGLAVRAAWLASEADVVAYMDADLSTDLDALLPLVAPLVSGHSDIAVGSRLAEGARIVRSPRRELISRAYNALLRWTQGMHVSDAQCGFKAARRAVVAPLLAHVEDDGWFFDAELVLLAEHNGLRVHEVAVDWVEDPDTRVHVAATAWEDVRGLVRMARARATGAATIPSLPHRPEPPARDTVWQLLSFGAIGTVTTIANALLYALLRTWWPALVANAVTVVVMTILNTEANRRLTFVTSRGSTGRVHVQGLVVFALYYLFTSAALLALQAVAAQPARWLEVAVLLTASLVGTAGRFLLLRGWVFRPSHTPTTEDV